MLSDYIGINSPAAWIMNMMDIAKTQEKTMDVKGFQTLLKILVIPIVALEHSDRGEILSDENLEKPYENIDGGNYKLFKNIYLKKA